MAQAVSRRPLTAEDWEIRFQCGRRDRKKERKTDRQKALQIWLQIYRRAANIQAFLQTVELSNRRAILRAQNKKV